MSKAMFYQNSQYKRVMNSKYKSKYKKLKRTIKSFVFENAALCDCIAQVQEELSVGKNERRYLLKRLMKHEGLEQIEVPSIPVLQHIPAKRGPKKRTSLTSNCTNEGLPKTAKSFIDKPTNENVEKQSTVVTKRTSIQKIPLDSQGKPAFPINLGGFILHSIGDIVLDNPNFHTENWIYPVGYVATRVFAHPKEPERKCVFTCKILNNSGVPQFQIIPDAEFDSVFFGESANICHLGLLETITRATDVTNLPLRPQGERFFGLGNPTVMLILQSDANFKKCINFKGFIVDGGYAIEDKDPTLNYDALQTLITISAFHTVPEVKEEPPDELLE